MNNDEPIKSEFFTAEEIKKGIEYKKGILPKSDTYMQVDSMKMEFTISFNGWARTVKITPEELTAIEKIMLKLSLVPPTKPI